MYYHYALNFLLHLLRQWERGLIWLECWRNNTWTVQDTGAIIRIRLLRAREPGRVEEEGRWWRAERKLYWIKSSVRDIEGLYIRKIELNWMEKSQKTNSASLTKMIETKKILNNAKGSSEIEKVQVCGIIHSFNYTQKWLFSFLSALVWYPGIWCAGIW